MIETMRKAKKREVSVAERKKREEYRGLIQRKKDERQEKWLRKVEADKSLKKFWGEINGEKRG